MPIHIKINITHRGITGSNTDRRGNVFETTHDLDRLFKPAGQNTEEINSDAIYSVQIRRETELYASL
jgi:hypothetical protein